MKTYFRNIWRAVTGKRHRGYREIVGMGSAYQDWVMSFLSEDGDLRNNYAALLDRSRDVYKANSLLRKYKEQQFANVFGDGYRLRMKIKEESDRVVYAADEKAFWEAEAARRKKLRDFVNERLGVENAGLFRNMYNKAKATVKAGAQDLYACRLIEAAWEEWKRAEFCTMSGRFSYKQTQQLRLHSCSRDGGFFIRLIRGGIRPDTGEAYPNKFGFSLQLINYRWCDYELNIADTGRGTSIRMGVEIDGWGKEVAFHFIAANPQDWQNALPSMGNMGARKHQVIPAEEIIHYARLEDVDSTRGAPWAAAVMSKIRQLDKYEEAEVIAARAGACKMGFLVSSIQPQGGEFEPPDPCKKPSDWEVSPGSVQGLPYGVDFKPWEPSHPNQNFDQFRRGMGRSISAGLPGADYNSLLNDLENINFSAGRLGRLDANEQWKLLQQFDIETAEIPIFEAWLEMALTVQAIKLPLAKLAKYNKPCFSGRRWGGAVDPIKETQAAVMAIQNKLMSYSQWFDDNGKDIEEEWERLAHDQMLADELGIDLTPVDKPDKTAPEDEEDGGEKEPKAKHGTNGNGHSAFSELRI